MSLLEELAITVIVVGGYGIYQWLYTRQYCRNLERHNEAMKQLYRDHDLRMDHLYTDHNRRMDEIRKR